MDRSTVPLDQFAYGAYNDVCVNKIDESRKKKFFDFEFQPLRSALIAFQR